MIARTLLMALLGLSLALPGCGGAEESAPPGTGGAREPGPPSSSGSPAGSPASDPGPVRAGVLFRDATGKSGLSFTHQESRGGKVQYLPQSMGSGCGVTDYDGDGHLDVFLVQGQGPTDGKDPATVPTSKLFRGRGDGTFEDVTGRTRAGLELWGMGCLWFDYDNDSRPDLFVTAYGQPNRLLHQEADHTFNDVTKISGLEEPGNVWSSSATALDYDRDGLVDLYVGGYLQFGTQDFVERPELVTIYNEGKSQPATFSPFSYDPLPNRLFRNRGDGTFEDVTARAGVANPEGKTLCVLAADLDEDGWTDLFVANDVTPKALFLNQRNGTFKEVGKLAWVADIRGSMGLACSDVDADGALDILCTHWIAEPNALYRSNLRGPPNKLSKSKKVKRLTFTEVSELSGLGPPSVAMVGWGCALEDLDRDGLPDVALVNGHTFLSTEEPRALIPMEGMAFLNAGNRNFRQVALETGDGLASRRVGRGLACGDFNEDGRVDLVVTRNNGPAELLLGQGYPEHHWLAVRLEGHRSHRDAVGSLVRVHAGKAELVRGRTSGQGYLSSSGPDLHFGLGPSAVYDRIVVHWSSGTAEEFPGGTGDRRVILIEGQGKILP